MSGALATAIRPAATRPTALVATPAGDREDEVNQDDVAKLMEQQAELLQAIERQAQASERQAVRMEAVAAKADAAFIDMNGLMGNDGVKATQARLLESHRSTRRELHITRRQIKDVGESLRKELRSLRDVIAEKTKADSDERIAAARRDQRSWFERAAYLLAAVAVIAGGGAMFWWVWMQASKGFGGG